MRLGEPGQARGQPVHAEGGQDRQVQGPAHRVRAQADRGLGQKLQGAAHLGHIVAGGGGQVQALAFADQEADAQLPLQPLQGAADGALGQVQLGRGGRGGAKAIHRL